MNTYLNIDESDMRITTIINDKIRKFNPSMDFNLFKDLLIELDRIEDGGLSEDMICDFQDNLSHKCPSQIKHFLTDNTQMLRG